jgi:hypothetical protein
LRRLEPRAQTAYTEGYIGGCTPQQITPAYRRRTPHCSQPRFPAIATAESRPHAHTRIAAQSLSANTLSCIKYPPKIGGCAPQQITPGYRRETPNRSQLRFPTIVTADSRPHAHTRTAAQSPTSNTLACIKYSPKILSTYSFTKNGPAASEVHATRL